MAKETEVRSTYVVFSPRAYAGWLKRRKARAMTHSLHAAARRQAAGKKKWREGKRK